MARPTDYKPSYCQEAEKLCQTGATDSEIAEYFKVVERTLYRWKAAHPEFSQALKSGKALADERVERSLYHKAIGYTFQSEKVFQFQGTIVRAKTTEHVPPDTTAGIFWLKNRRPDLWRDKSEVLHRHTTESMSDDELERVAAGRSEGTAEAPSDPAKLN